MRRGFATLAALGLLTSCVLTACQQAPARSTATPKIGVILPDSKSSARWETADRKYLEQAFRAARVKYTIQNAQNDKQTFLTIAEQMITSRVTVLMIVNLDSGTGKAVLDMARRQGVATIDYDRLTLGGSATYYVSFDNVTVGRLQGEGLVRCLGEKGISRPTIAELGGSQTDHNATLFRSGYDAVLQTKFASGEYLRGPTQSAPDWDNAQAAAIFEQMLTSQRTITGVLAANDGLGNAAISVLRKNALNGKVPVTGQDATVQGLQNILLGDQCMTVYKAVKREAQTAASLAVSLARGEKHTLTQSVYDPTGRREVPSVLLEPKAIVASTVKDVVDDGYVTVQELCTGAVADRCAAAGIR